jgi:hypothetical protein
MNMTDRSLTYDQREAQKANLEREIERLTALNAADKKRVNDALAKGLLPFSDEAKAAELLEQARSWRDRALTIGLDSDVKRHVLAKAADAESAAELLRRRRNGPDYDRAADLDKQAAEHDRKALEAELADLRGYHRDKARELRAQAAICRGEAVAEGARNERSTSFTA